MEASENPLLAFLGIGQQAWETGQATFGLTVGPQHLNRQGKLQGGVLATLLDVACGYAGLWRPLGEPPIQAVTVMLAVSYLATVQTGRVTATGRVTRSGRRIYFASGEVIEEDGTLLATAQGSFLRTGGLPGN
ncbi:PaaI family thioesterase [Roseomonas sp. WA12]